MSSIIKSIPVNVSNVGEIEDDGEVVYDCDPTTDDGQSECYFAFLDGYLDSYIITNGVVEPGSKIMNIIEVNPSSDSALTGIKLTLLNDGTETTAMGVLGIDTESGRDYGFFLGPLQGSGKNKKIVSTWTTSTSHPSNTSYILIADKGDNVDYPLNVAAPIWVTFYEINSTVSPGQDIQFNFGTSTTDTNASDKNSNNLTLSPHDLTLSVLSTVSVDGTLKTLTATGSNNLDYPFGFVASSKTDLTYSFMVPNAVTTVKFAGEATDSNVKGIVGLDVDKNLNVGDNSFTIAVTAESGDITNYSITVRRLSADTSLKTFTSTNDINFGTVANINSLAMTAGDKAAKFANGLVGNIKALMKIHESKGNGEDYVPFGLTDDEIDELLKNSLAFLKKNFEG